MMKHQAPAYEQAECAKRGDSPMNSLRARNETRKRHMKFVVVNGRTPRPQSFCALCCKSIGRVICENSQRGSSTAMTSATRVNARLPPQCSKNMRGRHDNHRRFEVPATNGSRPIAGGRLCGGTVSEVFHTREWICRRSSRCREAFDRLLLFS